MNIFDTSFFLLLIKVANLIDKLKVSDGRL